MWSPAREIAALSDQSTRSAEEIPHLVPISLGKPDRTPGGFVNNSTVEEIPRPASTRRPRWSAGSSGNHSAPIGVAFTNTPRETWMKYVNGST